MLNIKRHEDMQRMKTDYIKNVRMVSTWKNFVDAVSNKGNGREQQERMEKENKTFETERCENTDTLNSIAYEIRRPKAAFPRALR